MKEQANKHPLLNKVVAEIIDHTILFGKVREVHISNKGVMLGISTLSGDAGLTRLEDAILDPKQVHTLVDEIMSMCEAL